ncbi:hypothetical protein AHF37_08748 [Paragonimus kellicotti]|nr:hypothetical protein AHF37_08748 [Paragonimus kellicotti]
MIQTSPNFPSSTSYPMLHSCDSVPRQNQFYYNPSDNVFGIAKSSSSMSFPCGLRSNTFSPSYVDCRLRYLRQTRRLQKFIRITPEGQLLINDLRQRHHNNGQLDGPGWVPSKFSEGRKTGGEPVQSLISIHKLKRIHAAFWNLESRQELSESKSLHQLTNRRSEIGNTREIGQCVDEKGATYDAQEDEALC